MGEVTQAPDYPYTATDIPGWLTSGTSTDGAAESHARQARSLEDGEVEHHNPSCLHEEHGWYYGWSGWWKLLRATNKCDVPVRANYTDGYEKRSHTNQRINPGSHVNVWEPQGGFVAEKMYQSSGVARPSHVIRAGTPDRQGFANFKLTFSKAEIQKITGVEGIDSITNYVLSMRASGGPLGAADLNIHPRGITDNGDGTVTIDFGRTFFPGDDVNKYENPIFRRK